MTRAERVRIRHELWRAMASEGITFAGVRISFEVTEIASVFRVTDHAVRSGIRKAESLREEVADAFGCRRE